MNQATALHTVSNKKKTTRMGIGSIRPFHGCMDSVEDPSAYIEDVEYTVEVEVSTHTATHEGTGLSWKEI